MNWFMPQTDDSPKSQNKIGPASRTTIPTSVNAHQSRGITTVVHTNRDALMPVPGNKRANNLAKLRQGKFQRCSINQTENRLLRAYTNAWREKEKSSEINDTPKESRNSLRSTGIRPDAV